MLTGYSRGATAGFEKFSTIYSKLFQDKKLIFGSFSKHYIEPILRFFMGLVQIIVKKVSA